MILLCEQIEKHRPRIGDVGDDIVGLLEHPVAAPRDEVMRMDRLDPLWTHSIVVIFGLLV